MSAVPGRIVSTYCCSERVWATGRATGGTGRSRWKGWNGLDCAARAYALVRAAAAPLVEVERAHEGDAAEAARERGPAGDAVTFPIHHSPSLPARVSVRRSDAEANSSVAVTWIGRR